MDSSSYAIPDRHQDQFSKTYLGFWIYLMTDCILFAALFISYAVLKSSTFGGASSQDLFDLRIALAETALLLVSSVTCGMALLAAVKQRAPQAIKWLAVTLLLGLIFLSIEFMEFRHFVQAGHDWTQSAFLSSFFALVGMHGAHITAGLIWGGVMIGQLAYGGVHRDSFRRLVLFAMFWHFLDLIWIFIYSLVYLLGVI